MLFASAFVLLSLVLGFLISIEDINPFRPKPLPMLEQIELCMAEDEGEKEVNDLPLAA